MTRIGVVLTTSLLAFFSAAAVNFAAAANIRDTDHMVLHISTVPANKTEPVHLFVRERDGTPGGEERKAVLMLHGKTIPALPGFDLNYENADHEQYNWAGDLAQKGFDVFIMDLQGSGRSPRPKMDDPCNANPTQQLVLIPNPLSKPCGLAYAFQLNNSQSDWDELGRVIEFIRNEAHGEDGVQKVRLVSWSAGAFQVGPYTILHPEYVESVLFLAPAFRPMGVSNPPSPPPLPGFPMNIGTKDDFTSPWDNEQHCTSNALQREDGIVDVVWNAIMDNDVFGHHWGGAVLGQAAGVMRLRNAFWWGWNSDIVRRDTTVLGRAVPVLIVYGDQDKLATTPPLSIVELYNAIQGERKLMFKVACTGHYMPWERRFKDLHQISEQWLRETRVKGRVSGSYFLTLDGDVQSLP
jgi:pimeloyl-ACP methyl ester carboxylesterase